MRSFSLFRTVIFNEAKHGRFVAVSLASACAVALKVVPTVESTVKQSSPRARVEVSLAPDWAHYL